MSIFNLKSSDIIDLELKLDGKLPVDRDELLALVNSWGRDNNFYTLNKNGIEIFIKACEDNEKYDLSKLDVSLIEDFNKIFLYSYFNGDINSWDVSKATSMKFMFSCTEKFNQPLNNWDISNVTSMKSMFSYTREFNQALDNWNVSKVIDMSFIFYEALKFNQNLNLWDISKIENTNYMFAYTETFNQPVLWNLSHVESCYGMFNYAEAFKNRFNNNEELFSSITYIKKWLIDNKNKMIALDVECSKGNELDKFLLNINVITSTKLNGLHDNKNIINF